VTDETPPMDPDFEAMIARQAKALAALPMPAFEAIPIAHLRTGYSAERQRQNLNAPKDVQTRDLTVDGGAGRIAARLYVPAGAPAVTPGLVYFHGGGFALGDLESHDGHCRRLAAYSGCRVLAVDYRLAPEHPFPAGHDDALAATRWAFDHAAEIGFAATRIAVGGCSAGGNIAASVCLDLKADPQRKIVWQMLLYPVTWPDEETASRRRLDGPILTKAIIAWFERCLAVGDHPQHARTKLAEADVAGTPPTLLVTAGYDPLQDEGRAYAARLAAAGVRTRHLHYPALVHDFYIMADVSPAVEAAAREAAAALKAVLS
jgi:acetyl esterase